MNRKIILSMHVSLDGYVAGPLGEMDWIEVDEALFDFVGTLTDDADAALYGKNTYEMMESYWPAADEAPDATRHDIEHARWYRSVTKIVISTTTKETNDDKKIFIGEDIPAQIAGIKKQEGKNILIFGSPSASKLLMEHDLIDEYWLFVYPVVIGKGIPLFPQVDKRMHLKLIETRQFASGISGLHYKNH